MGLASARGAEQDHLKRRGNENHSGKEGMGGIEEHGLSSLNE